MQENAYLYAWMGMYTCVDMHARTESMYICMYAKGGDVRERGRGDGGGRVNILKTPLMHVEREGREIGLTGRCGGRDNGLHK